MDVSNVYGDIFRACTIKSISYQVYAQKQNAPQTQQDEFIGHGSLLRAEVALRYECLDVMASLSPSGDELWVYLWEESDDENVDKKSFPSELLESYGIETVAQGVFFPPFTGGVMGGGNLSRSVSSNALSGMASSADSGTSFESQSRYGPLVRAIELKFLDTLLRKGDTEQYEAFGTRAAISTGDGSVVRIRPILHQDGSLVLRLTSQFAELFTLPVNSIQTCAPLVWLLPQGKPCRILSALRYEDAFEPPSRPRARMLYYLLTNYSVTNVTLAQLESSMWLRVSSADTGGDLLWPIVLIRATPLTSSGYNLTSDAPSSTAHAAAHESPISAKHYLARNDFGEFRGTVGSGIHHYLHHTNHNRGNQSPFLHQSSHRHSHWSYPSRRPLIKILKPSPYAALTESMLSVRQELRHRRESSTPHGAGAGPDHDPALELHQTLNRPMAPPPSPRATTAAPSINPSLVPTAVPTAATTPAATTPAASSAPPLPQIHVYPTPTYQTPAAMHTPASVTPSTMTPAMPQDVWMDADEDENDQEVGDADFNFFDLPLNGSGNAASTAEQSFDEKVRPASPEVAAMDVTPSADTVNSAGTASSNSNTLHASKQESETSRIRNFSTLDLHSGELDSKYKSGGRFFVPAPPPSDDDQDEDMKNDNETRPAAESIDESDDDESSNSDTNEMSMIIDEDSDVDASESQMIADTTATYENEDVEKAWLLFITHEDSKYLPIDTSKFLSFRQLLPQIAYDGGLLSEIYDSPIVSGQRIVAPDYACNRLPWHMVHCPIGSSSNESRETPSRSSTPANIPMSSPSIPGNNAQQKKMQLLSPPLVALRRGKYTFKARVSILRFWRLLSLAPPLPDEVQPRGSDKESENTDEKDCKIVVILITLASPAIVYGARRVLNGLKGAYEGCGLGKVDLPTFGQVEAGLMQISADLSHTSGDAVGDLFQAGCAQLKSQLQTASGYGPNTNILVLMSYPPSSLRGGTLTAMVPFQLAQGFATIQAAYPESQWIMSSLDSLVSRWDHDKQVSEFEFEKLALLAYTRFPQFPQLFRLAGLVPHSSGLQYSVEMPQYLMEDEPVLHVAYLILEGRWCLASWSDQWARKVNIDVLKLSDNTERGLQLVFTELLKHSDTLARAIKDRPGWRFSITKCGTMAASEIAIWERVIRKGTAVVLMDIPHPRGIIVADHRLARPACPTKPLSWTNSTTSMPSPLPTSTPTSRDTASNIKSEAPSFSSNMTPASPVTAMGGSGNINRAAGNTGAARTDGVIVDAADEIYGISIDAPKAGVSRYAEATAQGYLVRPTADGHIALEARLLQLFGLQAAPRVAMSRVIGQFRRLASLSEFMGITTESTLIPWHIMALAKLEAAALKLNML